MVRDGSLSGLRTTFNRIAIAAATVALVAAAPPAFAADPAYVSFGIPTPDAGPYGIVLGPDNAMWFTEAGANAIGRIDTDGQTSEFALPDEATGPTAITVGPDDALWVTLEDGNAIGRMTAAGELDMYPLPAVGSSPAGITAGPDGGIWFTERFGDRIGRIDPVTLNFREFGLPPSTEPVSITTGPDDALWFTERSTPGLGRIDPTTGAISQIALPESSGPTGITSMGGALWVTLLAANQVARVTPDGNVALFSIPTAGSFPQQIVADPARDVLWFVGGGVSNVVRLSSNGAMEEFAVTAQAGLRGVAVDPSGRPWFTESRMGAIGRLDLEVAPPDATLPTIGISSPGTGAWTVRGIGALAAGYVCADEGGSGLATCEGTVADGAALPDDALGAARLEVHAADGAGNTADAVAAYLVFGSATGSALDPAPARPGEGLTLELGMELTAKASPLASAVTTLVACDTGEALGGAEPADVRTRVTHLGELSVRWVTERTWSGCRSLTLSFSEPGWSGADAIFGPIQFGDAKR